MLETDDATVRPHASMALPGGTRLFCRVQRRDLDGDWCGANGRSVRGPIVRRVPRQTTSWAKDTSRQRWSCRITVVFSKPWVREQQREEDREKRRELRREGASSVVNRATRLIAPFFTSLFTPQFTMLFTPLHDPTLVLPNRRRFSKPWVREQQREEDREKET